MGAAQKHDGVSTHPTLVEFGKDLADAAFAVLSQAERVPVDYARVAELLVRRGRLSGDAQALAPTVAAAAKANALIVLVIDFMSVSPFRNIGSRG